MAEQKEGGPDQGAKTTGPGAVKKTAHPASATESTGAPSEERGAAATDVGLNGTVARRKQQYLIGIRPLPGMAPMPGDAILQALKLMENVEIVRRLRPRGFQALTPGGMPGAQEIIVVRMDEQRGAALRQSAPPHIIVEMDAPLSYSQMMAPGPHGWQTEERVIPLPAGRRFDIKFRINGEGDKPLSGASVYVYRSGFPPSQAVTDSSGQASITLFDAAANPESIAAVYVKPLSDHWDRFIQNPAIDMREANSIKLIPLGKNAAKLAGERTVGWGQRMMKLDQLATGVNGSGVKIGLIDSGCDTKHPALEHVTRGADLTQENGATGWTNDEIGHGTHCAGIIAGRSTSPQGTGGFAPSAELHVFKLVPGGHFSDLIEALDQCIERQLDVVNLSFSSEQYSELVAQKVAEARLRGVACVAPAGNSGGPVQFPGNVPGVLTVSAVGKVGEFPPDTHHAQTVLPQTIGPAGLFATNFSCWGPHVAVCAPGVAIVSSVPGGGYAAWDGSSIAAAHVCGFAALLLAHHPLFPGTYGNRGEQRVAALFELIRGSAVPYVHAEPSRVGVGLPDLQRVPGMLQSMAPSLQQAAAMQQVSGALLGGQMWPTSFQQQQAAAFPNVLALMQQLRVAGLI